MREIFVRRGKRVDNGKWVYGNIVFTRSGRAFLLEGSFFSGESHEGDFKHGEIYGTEVIPETVGPHTGLTDKNGKKIFEGDIVKYENKIYEIKYLEKYARFAPSNEHSIFMVCAFNHLEVVGNIHDNPGLLKGE